MKQIILLFFIIILSGVCGYSDIPWSRNHVLKYSQLNFKNLENIQDYENLTNQSEYLESISNAETWLETEPVDVGDDFVADTVFVNFRFQNTDSTNGVLLQVRDSLSGEMLAEKRFFESGKLNLINMFHKNLFLYADWPGNNIQLFSFGLTRKPETVLKEVETWIDPVLLFYQESALQINFTLKFPSYLDIAVFDKNGRIVDYAVKKKYYGEGEYNVEWEPEKSQTKDLLSGNYIIYFYAKSLDNKEVEVYKKFEFVDR